MYTNMYVNRKNTYANTVTVWSVYGEVTTDKFNVLYFDFLYFPNFFILNIYFIGKQK